MKENSSEFFQNRACKYFPCHKNAVEEEFNCLFCYCPLYMLGRDCGGNFVYLSNGIKSCEKCTLPHSEGGYAHVINKFKLIAERIRQTENEKR